MKKFMLLIVLGIMCACNNGGDTPRMPKKERQQYENTEARLTDLESRTSCIYSIKKGSEGKDLIDDIKALNYDFDSTRMNKAAIQLCRQLQERVISLQKDSIIKIEKILRNSDVIVTWEKEMLVDAMMLFPVYLEKGDRLYFKMELQSAASVKLFNMDTRTLVKSYNQQIVDTHLNIEHTGIYLLELTSRTKQYADVWVAYRTDNLDRVYNVVKVTHEEVQCQKGDFGAYPLRTVKTVNIFDEPRKFTLRSQLKSLVSGSSIALLSIPVPAGASDILYSLRIATSEQDKSADGDFHKNIRSTYKRIKFMGLPIYEKTGNSGTSLLQSLLDDNRPLREEDAYCNMYLFRSRTEAKKFQDGTAVASGLNYDVDYSVIGSQSCNGRIPVKGSSKIYLGFENVRVRYTNYIWVEAVAVMPVTEYYTTKYSIE